MKSDTVLLVIWHLLAHTLHLLAHALHLETLQVNGNFKLRTPH